MIKLFEEYNQYYTKISNFQFHEEIRKQEEEDISDQEISIINQKTNILFERIRDNKIISRKTPISFNISKYQDDWYYIYTNIFALNKPIFSAHYKCDQLEGVIQCILHLKDNYNSLWDKFSTEGR